MKDSAGSNVTLFSEAGYDNLGLSGDFDIIILFHERYERVHMRVIEKVIETAENAISEFTVSEAYKLLIRNRLDIGFEIKEVLEVALTDDYDLQIIVQQHWR